MTSQLTIIFGLGFMSFCGCHFEFGWVIFIMTDCLEFRVWVFWQPFWTVISDFGLQASNFRSPHWAFVVLDRYIYLFVKWNRIQGSQYTHWLVSLLIWCCITIRDARPTLKQHWFNALCLKRIETVNCSIGKVSTVHTKYTILVQYCSTVCDAGSEFKQRINVFLLSNLATKGWSRSGHRGTLFTLLAMNGESPDMSPIEPTLGPIIGPLPCKPKGSICSLDK